MGDDASMADDTDNSDDYEDPFDERLNRSPGTLPVSDLVGDEVQRVPSSATLREICASLAERGVGIVGVGEPGAPLAGVVSERDIVAALAEGANPDTTTAQDIEVEHVYYVDPSTTLEEVAAEMLSKWTRHLFVGEPDDLLGVVSARDVLGAYASGADLD